MVSFEEACGIALKYMRDCYGFNGIVRPKDIGDAWLFDAAIPEEVLAGAPTVLVSKETGEAKNFLLFVPGNAERLRGAQRLRLPANYK